MQIKDIDSMAHNQVFKWPSGDKETYDWVISYCANSNSGTHKISVGYGKRDTYGKDRRRIVVWIDDYPYAEFFSVDDFNISGEVISEIRFYDETNDSKRMCRYADDIIPERYSMFKTDSLKRRVEASGVHDAWGIVVNISDHEAMIALAALRKYEKEGELYSKVGDDPNDQGGVSW